MVVTQEGDTVVIFQLMMKKLVSFKKQAISVKLASAEKFFISGLLLLEYYGKNVSLQEAVFVLWIYLPALNN